MGWTRCTSLKSLGLFIVRSGQLLGVSAVRPLSRLLLGLDTEAGQGGASLSRCGTHGEAAVKQSMSSSVWTAAGPVLPALTTWPHGRRRSRLANKLQRSLPVEGGCYWNVPWA